MTSRFNLLRAVLTTAALATSAAGVATAATASCDPMYPCFADAGTPSTVYDLEARAPVSASAPTAEGLDAQVAYRSGPSVLISPAAVYDLGARSDATPCQSYPCYPENTQPANPIAAEPVATLHAADQPG